MPPGRPRSTVSPCRFCNKQFKRREHLRRHERIHTNDKPFACECGQSFTRQDLLIRHSRVAHQGDPAFSAVPKPHSSGERSSEGEESIGTTKPPTPPLTEWETSNFITAPTFPSSGYSNEETEQTRNSVNLQTSSNLMTESDPSNPTFNPNLSDSSSFFPPELMTEFDFLWDYSSTYRDFLPINFLDTNYPLSQACLDTTMLENDNEPTYVSPQHSDVSQGSIIQQATLPPINNFRPLTALEAAMHKPNEERLPPDDVNEDGELDDNSSSTAWKVSISVYNILTKDIAEKKRLLPVGFAMPSRHTLSRFLEGYFQGFHKHLPFLHEPTF